MSLNVWYSLFKEDFKDIISIIKEYNNYEYRYISEIIVKEDKTNEDIKIIYDVLSNTFFEIPSDKISGISLSENKLCSLLSQYEIEYDDEFGFGAYERDYLFDDDNDYNEYDDIIII